MNALETIRAKIKARYEENPNIHMNIALTSPRISLANQAVTLKGVYPHIFRIEEYSTGEPRCYSLQYNDVLCGQIEITEFSEQA